MKKQVDEILKSIVHPETGVSIVDGGMLGSVAMSDDRIAVVLHLARRNDPFAKSIVKQIESRLADKFPAMEGKISVTVGQSHKKSAPSESTTATGSTHPQTMNESGNGLEKVSKVVVIASGKGGVGKSTVSSNLAVTLAKKGYRVGLLDADIYGPSQPKIFGMEGYTPFSEEKDGHEMILPAQAHGVKLMSIGFFIPPGDALIWRGPMATGALRQMIHQTDWGELDYLLIDLPPGTGDVHLTILQQMNIDGAVIVSTPQQIALEDVRRGVAMFRSDKVGIPILGVIENMAWFTPEELPDNKYYLFGRGGAARMAASEGLELLGEIPIVQSVMAGMESGVPGVDLSPQVEKHYDDIAGKIVEKLEKSVGKVCG